jgi:uncharacterized RDD family membrane protein YckC
MEKYGGFWRRFVALLIDGVIFGAIEGVVGRMLGYEIAGGMNLLLSWLYYSLMESSGTQATLGKMVMGLKVTDLDGDRITFKKATIRYFSKILSALILLIGFIMAAFNPQRQTLHDKIAGTYVMREGQYE